MPGLMHAVLRVLSKRGVGEVPEVEAAALFEARRRELLAEELLPDAFPPARLDPSVIGMRVAVVGAGLAGLSTAWFLSSLGAEVTVHEASGRVGGRVRTLTDFVPGRVVEAGAELIGTNHTYWWILAARFGLLPLTPISREDDYDDDLAVRLELDGHVLTDAEVEQLGKELLAVFDVLGDEARGIHRSAPWTSPDAAALDARSVGERLDELAPAGTFLRDTLELLIDNDNCAPVHRQSYLGLLTLISAGRWGANMRGYWELTETHRCRHGNQALADRIAAKLGAAVRLESPVTAVAVGADGVEVTADGVTETYAHAVLAVPPAVWDAISVSPAFDRAGRTMSHGPAVKYLARYPTPFWTGLGLAPCARSDRIGSVWESTDRQDTTPGAGLSAYSGGSYVLPDAAAYATQLERLYPQTPTEARLVHWPSTPWIGTGNSVPAPEEITTVARLLAEPHAGRLHFAGEQTTIGFSGYMEGALRSGARAARDIARTRLRAAGPPATPPPRVPELRAFSPLGPPASAGPAARSDHVAHVRGRTTPDPTPFAADRTLARWEVDDPAGTDDALRVVSAFWPGHAVVGADGMATVQLHPGLATRLRDLFGAPPPVLATYGPVDPVPFPAGLAGGEVLGRLDGPELLLGFVDDQGFRIDALAVLTRLAELGLLADCPLVPADGQSRPLHAAGPDPVVPGEPYLVLRVGAAGAAVHHPPDPLPADHFSFLAEQEILVGVGNAPGLGPYDLVVEDVTGLEYRTAAPNPLTRTVTRAVAQGDGQPFVPATDLPPEDLLRHSKKPGVPLAYRLEVTGAGSVPLRTTIGQSMRDVVRQEYTAAGLAEPGLLDRPVLPAVARHFTLEQFTQWNNYGASAVVAYLDQQVHIAEYVRRRYAARLADRLRTDPDSVPDTVTSYDLAVTSAWRNPQRNRKVGGDNISNHLYGRALDLAPVAPARRPSDRRRARSSSPVPGPSCSSCSWRPVATSWSSSSRSTVCPPSTAPSCSSRSASTGNRRPTCSGSTSSGRTARSSRRSARGTRAGSGRPRPRHWTSRPSWPRTSTSGRAPAGPSGRSCCPRSRTTTSSRPGRGAPTATWCSSRPRTTPSRRATGCPTTTWPSRCGPIWRGSTRTSRPRWCRLPTRRSGSRRARRGTRTPTCRSAIWCTSARCDRGRSP